MAILLKCFNSLQTGKPIQRLITPAQDMSIDVIRFNSLQTGKPIQSQASRYVTILHLAEYLFQFPSNGKADPKNDI